MKFLTSSCSQGRNGSVYRGFRGLLGAASNRRLAIDGRLRLLRTSENIACVRLRPINLSRLCPHQNPIRSHK
jgi:hypothetical protein